MPATAVPVASSGCTASGVDPFINSTAPVGVPLAAFTTAVNEISAPACAVVGGEAIEVVVFVALIVTLTAGDELGAKLPGSCAIACIPRKFAVMEWDPAART